MRLEKNIFENNRAMDEGGATIYLNKPFIEEEQYANEYKNNLAIYEGSDGKASYP